MSLNKERHRLIFEETCKRVNYTVITLTCMVVGAMNRILFCWKYPVPVRDSYKYKEVIENWSNSGTIPQDIHIPPLGLFTLMIPHKFWGLDIINGAITINVVLGLLIICSIVNLSKELLHSKVIALFLGLIAATHPTLIRYSCQATRENSYLLFLSLTTTYIIKYLKTKKIYTIPLIAAFAAGAVLCRHEGLALFFVAGSAIYYQTIKSKAKNGKIIVMYLFSYLLSIVFITCIIKVPISYYLSYKYLIQAKTKI